MDCCSVFFFTVPQNRRHLFAGIPATQLLLAVQSWFRTLLSDACSIVRVSLRIPEVGPKIESEMSVRSVTLIRQARCRLMKCRNSSMIVFGGYSGLSAVRYGNERREVCSQEPTLKQPHMSSSILQM